MRIQRFQPGDVVRDLEGNTLRILEAHQDPHPPAFSHCDGKSARYILSTNDGPSVTRWDWQLSLPCTTNT